MGTMKKKMVTAGVVLMTAASAACGDDVTEPVIRPVTTVMIAPADGAWTGLLRVGDTLTLKADAMDAGGRPIPGHAVAWSVADTSVATVSPAGVLRAVGPGSTSVLAAVSGVTGRAHLTVAARPGVPATVLVSPQAAVLEVGQTQRYAARAWDGEGNEIVGAEITWTNDSPNVITLDATGLATAIAPGYGQVTATIRGTSTSVGLTVTTPQARE